MALIAMPTLPDLDGSPRPRRYPTERIRAFVLDDGSTLVLRPLLPQDSSLLGPWFEAQPMAQRRRRFHGAVGRLSAERLAWLADVDHVAHIAFGVLQCNGLDETLLAEARYLRDRQDPSRAEFAILVDTHWQRRGIGAQALHALLRCAASQGLTRLDGLVQADNLPMQRLALECGFDVEPDDEGLVRVSIAVPDILDLDTLPRRGRRGWMRSLVRRLAAAWPAPLLAGASAARRMAEMRA
jgi:protein lysine acetyltransferase